MILKLTYVKNKLKDFTFFYNEVKEMKNLIIIGHILNAWKIAKSSNEIADVYLTGFIMQIATQIVNL